MTPDVSRRNRLRQNCLRHNCRLRQNRPFRRPSRHKDRWRGHPPTPQCQPPRSCGAVAKVGAVWQRHCECSNQSGSSDGRWTAVSECLTLVERAGERRFTTQVMTAIATSDMAIAPIALVIFKGYAGLLPSLEGTIPYHRFVI